MRPVVTDGDVVMIFDALSAAGLLAVCVLLLLVGLVSLRYLRPMGNLPHMPALEWGARWFGPMIVAALLLYTIGLYLGVTYTSYPFTALAAGRFGIMIIILLPILLLPTQSDGWLLGLLVLMDALRFTSRNYRNWVLQRMESGGRQSHEWVILAVLLAGPTGAAAAVAYNGYQADLASLRVGQTARAQEAVEAALADQPVEAVTVAPLTPGESTAVRVLARDDTPQATLQGISDEVKRVLPTLRLHHVWSISVLTRDSEVEEAVRHALAQRSIASVTATRALGAEPSRVAVTVAGRTDETLSRAIGERVEQALGELGPGEGWQISVSSSIGPPPSDRLRIDLGAGSAPPP